ncbi:unnamed protein product [Taenia asiatica]|uniref:Seryl_tRNA_N domain-containing protein n=1 Tax=Taenia asiatica TaxID=60517 RepID=A0A0R3W9F5_TAEAS|nr:unnamed protein product [Taenia asiatica]
MLIERIFRRGLTIPTFRSAVLPTGSTLHRIDENFTPAVEAQPDFNVTELAHSVKLRGLTDVFDSGFFEHMTKQSREVCDYKQEIERLETRRQNLHTEFQEASKIGDEGRLAHLRAASKRIKEAKNRCKELHRNLSFSLMEDLLRLPNKLRETESALPSESWFGDTSKSTVLPSGAIKAADLDDLTVYKDCGTYFTGKLAAFTQEMSGLLALLGREVESMLGIMPRRCALSDLVRLPVAEACAWTPSLDEVSGFKPSQVSPFPLHNKQNILISTRIPILRVGVIQLEHTKDDILIPNEGGQPLINPYTRLCLVGSASLAAFVVGKFLMIAEITLFNCSLRSQVTNVISFQTNSPDKKGGVEKGFQGLYIAHFCSRLRAVPVEELRRCEIALWSLALVECGKPDIELARISLLGDWVSRRAGFKTFDGSFPFMVNFQIFNSSVLLLPSRVIISAIKG